MIYILCQERMAAEEAEIAEGEENQDGEEGEEEEDKEVDECLEENSTMVSLKRAAATAPQLRMGSLALSAPKKKAKAAPKRRSKADEDAEEETGECGGEVDPLVAEDVKLQGLAESLGYTPKCFSGLVLSKVLEAKEKPGHQLKGVGGCENVWMKQKHFHSRYSSMEKQCFDLAFRFFKVTVHSHSYCAIF